MRFTNIVIAFALGVTAQAYTIPDGITDGVYAVSIREDGVEVHTRIADSDAGPTLDHREVKTVSQEDSLERREDGRLWCGCGFDMNHGNCDAAVQDLKNSMGTVRVISARQAIYAIRQDVVAFICSRANRFRGYTPDMFTDDLIRITDSCGWYIAGSRQSGSDGDDIISGYMRWSQGTDFCAWSTGSGANHC